MKVAVLGWGSLVWDPGTLEDHLSVDGVNIWASNGPLLPIEYARVSDEGKGWLSLVIMPGVPVVTTLWAMMRTENLNEAIRQLKARERTSTAKIGYVNLINGNSRCQHGQHILDAIREWAETNHCDAVIWTDLESNFFETQGKNLTAETAIAYIQSLANNPIVYEQAKEYILRTPTQVQTVYRPSLENAINSMSLSS